MTAPIATPVPDPEVNPDPAEPVAPVASDPVAPVVPAAARGWQDDLPVNLRDHEFTKGYENTADGLSKMAETHINDQTKMRHRGVMLPSWDDADDVKRFRVELGMPEDASGYDLSEVEIPESARLAADEGTVLRLVSACHDIGLDQHQMKAIFGTYMGMAGEMIEANHNLSVDRRQESELALKKSWGGAYDANLDLANRALTYGSGGAPNKELLELKFEDGTTFASHPLVVQLLKNFGGGMNEAKMLGNKSSSPQPSTPDEAQAALRAFQSKNAAALVDRSLDPRTRESLLAQQSALSRAAYPESTE